MPDKGQRPKFKVPKNKERPQTGKHAETKANPDSYKTMNIAWRFNRLDDESKWGLRSISNILSCNIEQESLSEIIDGQLSHDSFYESAISISKGQDYDGIDHYMRRLTENVDPNGLIHPLDLRATSLQMKFSFFYNELVEMLKAQENMTWEVIEKATHGRLGKSKSHEISTDKIIKEARQRLAILEIDDVEELFSLRLKGKLRIWGIRNFNVLEIIWIDRDHEIYDGE